MSKKRDSFIDAYICRTKKNKLTGLYEVQRTVEPPETPKFPCPCCDIVCSNAGALAVHRRMKHTSVPDAVKGSTPLQLRQRMQHPVPFWRQLFTIGCCYVALMSPVKTTFVRYVPLLLMAGKRIVARTNAHAGVLR